MDNTIIPYQDISDTSSEDLDDSSSDDEHSHLLSNNIGVLHNKFITKDVTFMNMENAEDYQKKRNLLFTPQITKRFFTVDLSSATDNTDFPKSLKDDFKLPTKNIIGFKILKSSFMGDGTALFTDLSIQEIPDIACDKTETGDSIIARIPFRKVTSDFYTHQYLELSLIDRYFYPITLDTITFKLTNAQNGFVVIELSYLNE